jgi:hypothetical protein
MRERAVYSALSYKYGLQSSLPSSFVLHQLSFKEHTVTLSLLALIQRKTSRRNRNGSNKANCPKVDWREGAEEAVGDEGRS